VETYCYVAVCRRGRLDGARCFGARRGGEVRGHIVAAPAQLVIDDGWRYTLTQMMMMMMMISVMALVVFQRVVTRHFGSSDRAS